jgi:hypothetical protein
MTELVYWIEFEVGGEEGAKRRRAFRGETERDRYPYEREKLFSLNGM